MFKNYLKRGVTLALFSLTLAPVTAQEWVDGMRNHEENFYNVQSSFEKYWAGKDHQERGKGWKPFKRWEAFWEPRVYPSGERPNPAHLWHEVRLAKDAAEVDLSLSSGDWQPMGPYNGNDNSMGGIGRINGITFDPTNSEIIWVGAPSGGLWKSTDKGQSWSTNTDLLPNLGVSVIVINPKNTDEMYITTGDRDVTDTYSYGILKSTDGGNTWDSTGLSYNITQFIQVTGLIIDPNHPDTLIATTSQGIFHTVDGGDNWTGVQVGNFVALAHKPGDFNIQYATTRNGPVRFFRSIDGGLSWTHITTGLPSSQLRRAEIAVTPDDPDYVYLVYARSDNGFHSICRSTNSGLSFTEQCNATNTPNLLGWAVDGNDSGGQAWYDLCIAASPSNKNEIFVGGVNIWKSTNGGANWSINAHWFGGGGNPYVHADQHTFTWEPGTSNLWNGNDGGVSKTTNGGNTWSDHNNGLNITQYYRIGLSATNSEILLGGTQDNGTHRKNATNWRRVRGGDGMECAIDPLNGNIMYASVYYGDFRKSINGGNNFNASFNLPPSGSGNWVTPFVIDQNNPQVLYAGFSSLWKSTNRGVSFTATSGPVNGTTNINAITVAPSNSDVIYVASQGAMFRSDNGGTTWTTISNTMQGTNTITYIAVSDYDPMKVWVSRSGYSASTKVFYSENGGASWINLTDNLPNLPVNCILYENNSNDAVYVGTDVGVYYRDNTQTEWLPFMTGLPNVIVNELEIHYDTKTIRAATYGRGVWESPTFNELQRAPLANFIGFPTAPCSITDTVTFENQSLFGPQNFLWNITPSTFSYVNNTADTSSTIQVVFNQPGAYNVALTVSNFFGSDTKTAIGMVRAGGYSLPFFEGFETPTSLNRWQIINPDNGISWSRTATSGNGSNWSMQMNFYNYANAIGQQDELISPAIAVNNHDSITLSFDFAYRRYNFATLQSDTLRVLISNDCGTTWSIIQTYAEDGSGTFQTGGPLGSPFVPSLSQDWCGGSNSPSCAQFNLMPFLGNAENLLLKFQSVNNYGNNLYIDNINISGIPTASPVANFGADTSVCAGGTVAFTNLTTNTPTQYSWSFPGGNPAISNQENPLITYPIPGSYPVTLIAQNGIGSDTLTLTQYINVTSQVIPSVQVIANLTNVCPGELVTFNAIPTNGGTAPVFAWYLNGNRIGGNQAQIALPLFSNTDTVYCELESSEDCISSAMVAGGMPSVTVYNVPSLSWQLPTSVFCIIGDSVQLTGTNIAGGTFSGPGVSNGYFKPLNAGGGTHTLTYTYQTATGCETETTVQVTVQPAPSVSFNFFNEICINGAQAPLTGGFPFNGTYFINGQVATVLNPASYSVGDTVEVSYAITSGVCTTENVRRVYIAPEPPTPTITLGIGTLTCDQAGFQYQWLDILGNIILGANGQTFSPTVPGTYRVRISINNECAKVSEPITINSINIDQLSTNQLFRLFPNPNTGVFKINYLGTNEEVLIKIYNAAGQTVFERSFMDSNGNQERNFELIQLSSGVYTLQLIQKEGASSQRFTIQ